MIYMFLSNNPSSGDINSSNLPCFSNSNNRRMTFAHVAILLSSTQQVVVYLVALKHFDYS